MRRKQLYKFRRRINTEESRVRLCFYDVIEGGDEGETGERAGGDEDDSGVGGGEGGEEEVEEVVLCYRQKKRLVSRCYRGVCDGLTG